jgi:hypothetical protein
LLERLDGQLDELSNAVGGFRTSVKDLGVHEEQFGKNEERNQQPQPVANSS